jgi:hypothetical protein
MIDHFDYICILVYNLFSVLIMCIIRTFLFGFLVVLRINPGPCACSQVCCH